MLVWIVLSGIPFSENNNNVGKRQSCSLHKLPDKNQFLRDERQFFTCISTELIKLYQLIFSSRQGEVCNFTPSCSHYAQQTIEKYGLKGMIMSADRLERCNYFAWQYKDKYYKVKWIEGRGYKLYDPLKL